MERRNLQRLFRLTLGIVLVAIPVIVSVISHGFSLPAEVVEAAPASQSSAETIVTFTDATYVVSESDPEIDITVKIITTSITSDVTVEYLTSFGTATEGGDYVATSGVLTFTPADPANKSFKVTINSDTVDEPNESVGLILRNPSNATLGSISEATLTIVDDDASPTATATATTGAPPIFIDAYEPNNSLADAFATAASAAQLCDITLWPTGDEDYFKFWGRAGSAYEIFTTNLDAGLDTFLTVYDIQGNAIATNDDAQSGVRRSELTITANVDGFYYARIVNQDPSDPADRTYCFGVDEIQLPTATATGTAGPLAGDECEYNSTFETACLMGAGELKTGLSFVPSLGSQVDTDVFRMWMKPGLEYTCETLKLSSVNDTNIILYDANGNSFNPPIGNDDKEPGDLGSKVSYLSTYTGWLYIMVGPVSPPALSDASLYTYDLSCTVVAATATPTATPTFRFVSSSTASTPTPSPTPVIFPTFPPTPTPIDLSQFATAVPQAPPAIQFQPLATATPIASEAGGSSVSITLYYDDNENFTPELTEGIIDVAVALYDNATGQLLQFGHTNEAGVLNFGSVAVAGAVRIEVPFLNYSQIVVGTSSNILLRIAPQPLPASIP
jgi:hypothetical protein